MQQTNQTTHANLPNNQINTHTPPLSQPISAALHIQTAAHPIRPASPRNTSRKHTNLKNIYASFFRYSGYQRGGGPRAIYAAAKFISRIMLYLICVENKIPPDFRLFPLCVSFAAFPRSIILSICMCIRIFDVHRIFFLLRSALLSLS